jgi:hypothetical protein
MEAESAAAVAAVAAAAAVHAEPEAYPVVLVVESMVHDVCMTLE